MTKSAPALIAVAGILALVCAIFAIRLAGPWKLMDLDQERPVQYAMDVYLHDRWIVQTDSTGDIASKPPIYPWLVAIGAHALGGVSRLAVYLPTALGIAGSGVVILLLGRSVFGLWPGVFGALAFTCSTYSFKMVHLARTDPLFCMWVALASACAWLAWQARATRHPPTRWIIGFWAFATLATLTKGPLGVVIAALGLLAIFWERKTARAEPPDDAPGEPPVARRRILWTTLAGAAGLVLIASLWLFAAYAIEGRAVVDKMLGRELIGHAMRSDSGDPPLIGFWKTWVYFLSRYLPWSIIAFIAVARVVLRPSADDRARRFERFCACWLMGGLIMFSVFPHQRPDLLLPLIPAGALLVGRQIDGWLQPRPRARWLATGAIVAVAFAAVFSIYHVAETRENPAPPGASPTRWDKIVRTREMREFAAEISARDLPNLHFAGGPLALQIFLGVKKPLLSIDQAREILAAPGPAYIVVGSPDALREGLTLRVVLSHTGVRDERLYVITND